MENKENKKKNKAHKIDIFLKNIYDEKFLFDIKTAKPNKDVFKGFKRTLLEWIAAIFEKNLKTKANTIIPVIPNLIFAGQFARILFIIN
jgi:type II restriction enzyme